MFTGIIEATATLTKIEHSGDNINFTLTCPFTQELKIDQSLAHNGCCLTVVKITDTDYSVTAIAETLEKTNLGKWNVGTEVNLERCLKWDGRLDGHIVQGHVDKTGTVEKIEDKDGSYFITISYNGDGGFITVPQVVKRLKDRGIGLEQAEKFIQELAWREFYTRTWFQKGNSI